MTNTSNMDLAKHNELTATQEIDKLISVAEVFLQEFNSNPFEKVSAIIGNLHIAKSLLAELIVSGISHPVPSQFIRQIESGNRTGVTRDMVIDELTRLNNQKLAFKGGMLPIRSVNKSITNKSGALAWLDACIGIHNCAARNGVLLTTINSAHYALTLQLLRNGLPDGYITDEEIELRRAHKSRLSHVKIAGQSGLLLESYAYNR